MEGVLEAAVLQSLSDYGYAVKIYDCTLPTPNTADVTFGNEDMVALVLIRYFGRHVPERFRTYWSRRSVERTKEGVPIFKEV